MKFLSIIILFLAISPTFSKMYHHHINNQNIVENGYCFTKETETSFNQLLVSWNAIRPTSGYYSIYVSVNTGSWSPWLLYAKWGKDVQKGFISNEDNFPFRVYQNIISTSEGICGVGFKIKIIAEEGADLSTLQSLHICANDPTSKKRDFKKLSLDKSYTLEVEGLSQMAIKDSLRNRLCSTTSTTAVINFIKKDKNLDPIEFAEKCWDSSFDIYGNWVLNVAEAYNQINDSSYSCWVEQADSFEDILDSLKRGFPVVISVRSPLPGSAQIYEKGHLLVVTGYDSKANEVLCMDPAFDRDEETKVRYNLDDLIKAWERRNNIAYIFEKL